MAFILGDVFVLMVPDLGAAAIFVFSMKEETSIDFLSIFWTFPLLYVALVTTCTGGLMIEGLEGL